LDPFAALLDGDFSLNRIDEALKGAADNLARVVQIGREDSSKAEAGRSRHRQQTFDAMTEYMGFKTILDDP